MFSVMDNNYIMSNIYIQQIRCIHHFNSDLINNMDHVHISSTGPSSVILSQKRSLNSWKVKPKKVPK